MDVFQTILEASIEAAINLNASVYGLVAAMANTFVIAVPVFLLVLLVTGLLYRWLSPWARFALWSIVLVRMLMPVSVPCSASVQNLWSLANAKQIQSAQIVPTWLLSINVGSATDSIKTITLDDEDEPLKPPTLFQVFLSNLQSSLTTLMLAGMLVVAGRSLIAFSRLNGWLRVSRECTDSYCIEQAEIARRSLGIGSAVQLRMVHQLTSAATFDWFRPTILLPESITLRSHEEQQHIIWHEMARIRRGDSATSLICTAAAILQWWNPLFWWTSRRWTIEREYACDALALNQLGRHSTGTFVQLLQTVHTNLPKSKPLITNSPGFVMSINSPTIEKQRIKAIRSDDRRDSRWKYWFSWCVVLPIAVTSLTDALKVPLPELPIQLPAKATWHDAEIETIPDEELETRTYDMTRYLAGLGLNEQHYLQELSWIALTFNSLLNPAKQTHPIIKPDNGQPEPASDETEPKSFKVPQPARDDRCQVNDHQLTIRAKPSEHELIARVMEDWIGHEPPQITIEVRTISTRLDPSQLLPAVGSKIFNSKPILPSLDSGLSHVISGSSQLSVTQSHQSPLPVLTCPLKSAEVKKLITRSQNNQRASVLFAPKVTLFSLQTCEIRDERNRHFITGMLTESETKPRKESWSVGIRYQIFAYSELDKAHLRIRCEISSIADVRTRQFRMDETDLAIQIPQRHSSVLETTAIVSDGDTWIMVPLERDNQGFLTLVLITPRIITIASQAIEEAKSEQWIEEVKKLKTDRNEGNHPAPDENSREDSPTPE